MAATTPPTGCHAAGDVACRNHRQVTAQPFSRRYPTASASCQTSFNPLPKRRKRWNGSGISRQDCTWTIQFRRSSRSGCSYISPAFAKFATASPVTAGSSSDAATPLVTYSRCRSAIKPPDRGWICRHRLLAEAHDRALLQRGPSYTLDASCGHRANERGSAAPDACDIEGLSGIYRASRHFTWPAGRAALARSSRISRTVRPAPRPLAEPQAAPGSVPNVNGPAEFLFARS
jgi:hypothetical protein